jgi:hypothetical protein
MNNSFNLIFGAAFLCTLLSSNAYASRKLTDCELASEINNKSLYCDYNGIQSNGIFHSSSSCRIAEQNSLGTLTAFTETMTVTEISRATNSYLLATDTSDLPISCILKK